MPHRHRLALLALLATAPRGTLSRDALTAMLWPEHDRARARNLLNVAIHGCRQLLGGDVLHTVGNDLRLDLVQVSVDALEFEVCVAREQHAAAVDLYRGPFLHGFFLSGSAEFDRWQESSRERCAGLYRRALEALAGDAARRGAHGDAASWRRLIVALDPLNTGATMDLMLALERGGDAAGALRVAQLHEALWRAELEVEPDPALRRLVERIKSAPAGESLGAPAGGGAEGAALSLAPLGALPPPAAREGPALGGTSLVARRTRAAAVTVGIAAVAAVGAAVWPRAPAPANRVVLMPFVGSDSTLAIWAGTVERAVAAALAADPTLVLLHPPATDRRAAGKARSGARARALGHEVGAGTVVEALLTGSADSVWLEARLISASTGRMTRPVRVSSPSDASPAGFASAAAERVAGALAMTLDPRLATMATPGHAPPNAEALAAFRRGLDLFARAEYGPSAAAFRRAVQADSSFSIGRVMLAFTWYHGAMFAAADSVAQSILAADTRFPAADVFAMEWLRARLRGDVPAAHRAAREAARLAPTSPWAFAQAEEAVARRRPSEAVNVLRRLDPEGGWLLGWSAYPRVLGQAHHLLGEFDRELTVARRGSGAGTNRYASLIAEARPLAALGRERATDSLINEALATPDQPTMSVGSLMQRVAEELRAHGHADAARRAFARARAWYEDQLRRAGPHPAHEWALGRMLMALTEWDSAGAVLGAFFDRAPRTYAVQADLGMLAAHEGDRARAAYFDTLLAEPDGRLSAFDAALRVYYRACIAALLGERARALELLQRAVAMGVPMPLDSAHVAPALHSLRGLPAFDNLGRVQR